MASSKEFLPQRAQRAPRKNFHKGKKLKAPKTQIPKIEGPILSELKKVQAYCLPGEPG
jgi:hypothetical protein